MNNTEFQFVENQLWARKCSFTGIDIDIELEGDNFHLMFEQAGVDMPEKLEGPEFEEAFDEVRSILKAKQKPSDC